MPVIGLQAKRQGHDPQASQPPMKQHDSNGLHEIGCPTTQNCKIDKSYSATYLISQGDIEQSNLNIGMHLKEDLAEMHGNTKYTTSGIALGYYRRANLR